MVGSPSCAHEPGLYVRMRIEGDSTVGYTAGDAFNIGTPGNGGAFSIADGAPRLAVSFQEYWPGSPASAPGVFFLLWESDTGLAGTARTTAPFLDGGTTVATCMFDFTLTGTRAR